jgi:predicted nuclease of predicted toxin-antitoxin system
MKILVDMNLSPGWCATLAKHGWEACHWSSVGDPCAHDRVLMDWANTNGYVVFTNDLDFGTLLAASEADGPSVIQIRAQGVLPADAEDIIVAALRQFEAALKTSALVTVDAARSRVRILPLRRGS